MAESKSDDTAFTFNAHSDLSRFVRPLTGLVNFPGSEWKLSGRRNRLQPQRARLQKQDQQQAGRPPEFCALGIGMFALLVRAKAGSALHQYNLSMQEQDAADVPGLPGTESGPSVKARFRT